MQCRCVKHIVIDEEKLAWLDEKQAYENKQKCIRHVRLTNKHSEALVQMSMAHLSSPIVGSTIHGAVCIFFSSSSSFTNVPFCVSFSGWVAAMDSWLPGYCMSMLVYFWVNLGGNHGCKAARVLHVHVGLILG